MSDMKNLLAPIGNVPEGKSSGKLAEQRAEYVEMAAEEKALIVETLLRIDAMLAQLPIRVRSAFLMSQLHGMTYAAIAAELGVSERMVKKY
ncbi:MAG: ECF subfamily RNA polymerase sigma-70 factor, partial [Microgenomates group bacterium GW2011_GWC1_44_9]